MKRDLTEEERFILQRRKFEVLIDDNGYLEIKCPACGTAFSADPSGEPHDKCIHIDGSIIAVEECKCGHVSTIKDRPYARNEALMSELRPYVDRR